VSVTVAVGFRITGRFRLGFVLSCVDSELTHVWGGALKKAILSRNRSRSRSRSLTPIPNLKGLTAATASEEAIRESRQWREALELIAQDLAEADSEMHFHDYTNIPVIGMYNRIVFLSPLRAGGLGVRFRVRVGVRVSVRIRVMVWIRLSVWALQVMAA